MQNTTSRMRPLRLVLGIALVALGLVWVGQGLGLVGGSFMSSDGRWALVGIVVAGTGLFLAVSARPARA